MSAKPAQVQQDKSLKITQINDLQDKIESPKEPKESKEIGSGENGGDNVFIPETDDEDVEDTFVYEEDKKVVLITEAPEVVEEETTRNQEFYDYVEQNYRSKK